jgi:hypothetical protein
VTGIAASLVEEKSWEMDLMYLNMQAISKAQKARIVPIRPR